ncbi:hypothetical protein CUB97_02515 [Prevotella intermedia]|uniref:Uncharacterized protein n=1 Tax=Prevotella intermedia TaxID=28131 RepID=A0A2M8M7Q8_PREIN|nr:hypothetical protein CUB97_02515 [Prevotella intermedia]
MAYVRLSKQQGTVGKYREQSGKEQSVSLVHIYVFLPRLFSFIAKTIQASAEESLLILCRAQLVLCKINIGYFLFHHFSFTWQLVAL